MLSENNFNSGASLATLTLFGYDSVSEKLWAFGQMGFAGRELMRSAGLNFWKLVGSGNGGGFSLQPDWARYGVICSWENERSADDFLGNSNFMKKFRRHAAEVWTVKLLPIKSHGAWSGKNPFAAVTENQSSESKPLAVLTRATINLNKLKRFWSFVPATSKELNQANGLIASIGIGEAPFFRQATFSLWESAEVMKRFAYQSVIHKEVVNLTRQEKWYKEELFARFIPIASEGTWNGRDPLAGRL